MVPECDPEIRSVELHQLTVQLSTQRADTVRRWWKAMARSHAALAKPIQGPDGGKALPTPSQ
jgi:hypothetical protein